MLFWGVPSQRTSGSPGLELVLLPVSLVSGASQAVPLSALGKEKRMGKLRTLLNENRLLS